MEGLRVSHVAPNVEDNLGKLNELVKQMGNKGGDLTESQNRRMVAYLGNVDEMRQQLVIMVQRYEDDERILKRLLDLVDRIDDVKSIIAAGNVGNEEEQLDGADINMDDEIGRQIYDQPFNPLMVSNKDVSLLAVSGLADDAAYAASLSYQFEEEENAPNPWDHEDDPDLLAASIELEEPNLGIEELNINLTVSSVGLPTVLLPVPPPPPPPRPTRRANAGVTTYAASSSSSSSSRRVRRAYSDISLSSSEDSGSDSDSSAASVERPQWRRATRRNGVAHVNPVVPPAPAPPAPQPQSKGKRRVYGPCAAVTCKICYDEYFKHEDIYEFDECAHTYCRECLKGYFETNINEGAVLDLNCPCPGCETEVDIEDIRFLCDYDTVAKYERFVVIASLKADPNTRWCPGPNCVNGIKVGTPPPTWLHCTLCNLDFCYTCLQNKHEGTECSKAALAALAARKEEEDKALESFKKWAEEHQARVKPCPLCHTFIEKTEGCNHMTCGNISCRHQFCWLCLGNYDNGNHFNDFTNIPNCYDKQFYTPTNIDILEASIYQTPANRRRFGRIAKKIGIYVGVGMAVVTLGVPAAVIGGPVYGCFQLHKRLKAKRERRGRQYAHNPNFVPPSPDRIAEARREVERLRRLEAELR